MKNNLVKLSFLSILFTAPLFALFVGSSHAGDKDIAIVHSYHKDLGWVQNQSSGFQKVLGPDYEYFELFMDTKRIPSNKFKDRAKRSLDYIKSIKPALVYVTDDNALNLVGRYVEGTTPVVFSGVNAHIRNEYSWILNTDNISGVLERPLIKRTITQMRKILQLKAQKVLVLMGTSTSGIAFFENDLQGQAHFKLSNTEVRLFRSGLVKEWKEAIRNSKDEGYDMLMITANMALSDESGNKVDAFELDRWISKNSPNPAFTVHSDQVGKDLLVGQMVLSGTYMGEDAGEIAKKILKENMRPRSISIRAQRRGKLVFSKTQLKKWGLKVAPQYIGKVEFVD